MIPGSVSLAVCTVFFRRLFDNITRRAAAPALSYISQIPNPSSLLMASAALICLYSQMKNGMLVSIGKGHPRCSSSKSFNERRSKSKSWFLKNIWGRRKNCTRAIHQMAKQFTDSFTNINPCLLLPRKTFQVSFPEELDISNPTALENLNPRTSCDVIYNNEVFDKDSSLEVVKTSSEVKKSTSISGGTGKVGRKRKKRSDMLGVGVKRLMRELNIGDGPTVKQSSKIKMEDKRMTRSGKIYNVCA